MSKENQREVRAEQEELRAQQDELRTQVEYTNVDQRGDLTGPGTDKANYPRRPQHVSIQQKRPGQIERG
ncbi:hypothetical protein [Bacillus thermotolerans]|uniref:hypothetical protein n=1 Tax=Bacillus thermotolerans TaxID=1221996 RepID=UPI00057F1B58|nr:hypothetical protein [Bacillus thermotolerans]KKB34414.1 hypothetical protein QY97_02487 [Bacillus thermotolerans]